MEILLRPVFDDGVVNLTEPMTRTGRWPDEFLAGIRNQSEGLRKAVRWDAGGYRLTGPTQTCWEAPFLPLNYTR